MKSTETEREEAEIHPDIVSKTTKCSTTDIEMLTEIDSEGEEFERREKAKRDSKKSLFADSKHSEEKEKEEKVKMFWSNIKKNFLHTLIIFYITNNSVRGRIRRRK